MSPEKIGASVMVEIKCEERPLEKRVAPDDDVIIRLNDNGVKSFALAGAHSGRSVDYLARWDAERLAAQGLKPDAEVLEAWKKELAE